MNSSDAPTELETSAKTLQESAEALRDKLGKKLSLARILGVVGDIPCPKRCVEELRNPAYAVIDSYYGERHNYLRGLLVDALRARLIEEKFRVRIGSEEPTRFGRGDVDIQMAGSGISVSLETYTVRVELKGGLMFKVGQAVRYLMDVDALVILMAARGSAFAVTKEEARELVAFAASTYADKLDCLLDDQNGLVPGPWCEACPVLTCVNRKEGRRHSANFQKEFVAALPMWPRAIEQTVEVVVDLLKMRATQLPKASPGSNASPALSPTRKLPYPRFTVSRSTRSDEFGKPPKGYRGEATSEGAAQ
ncbi:MAG: hypothetical protein OK452_09085 [Thaumarchaeota archaeon]|nr:hypothetical protein [Nitrososphaerota archaeon]